MGIKKLNRSVRLAHNLSMTLKWRMLHFIRPLAGQGKMEGRIT
jgi:hypothetical protein